MGCGIPSSTSTSHGHLPSTGWLPVWVRLQVQMRCLYADSGRLRSTYCQHRLERSEAERFGIVSPMQPHDGTAQSVCRCLECWEMPLPGLREELEAARVGAHAGRWMPVWMWIHIDVPNLP